MSLSPAKCWSRWHCVGSLFVFKTFHSQLCRADFSGCLPLTSLQREKSSTPLYVYLRRVHFCVCMYIYIYEPMRALTHTHITLINKPINYDFIHIHHNININVVPRTTAGNVDMVILAWCPACHSAISLPFTSLVSYPNLRVNHLEAWGTSSCYTIAGSLAPPVNNHPRWLRRFISPALDTLWRWRGYYQ